MNISHRAFQADIDADTEGRTIVGMAVPYNSPTTIAERGLVFEEQFAPGAFDDSIAKRGDRIPILLMHDSRALPVGKPVAFRSKSDGLHLEARISDTVAGNDALTLVRDGVLSGLSVGFSVPDGGEVWSNDMRSRTITRALLHETSICNFPAYDDARIASVRDAEAVADVEPEPVEDAARASAAAELAAMLLGLWEKKL